MKTELSSAASEHNRYVIQAEWTVDLRSRILGRINVDPDARLLEVGSGTGAITTSVAKELRSSGIFGVDIVHELSVFASGLSEGAYFSTADGHKLPFVDGSFDVAFSHFLLLWVRDAERVLNEMKRVVRPGGWVIAFAEPDYGSRIDYPAELEHIGRLQAESLLRSGADPEIGRRLRALFASVGLTSVVSGVLGGEWHTSLDDRLTRSEWDTLKSDLQGRISEDELERLENADREAWKNQKRILFVPTFYAYGQVG